MTEEQIPLLAELWLEGWREAHEHILPKELAKYRTIEAFSERLRNERDNVFVVGDGKYSIAFYLLKGDELNQFYLAPEARGLGIGAQLLRDAEYELSRRGVTTAWLACAIGNDRAARFYEKHGWEPDGVKTIQLPTPDGDFPLDVWRYSKILRA